MTGRLAVPAIFFAGFAFIFGRAFLIFFPIFFQSVMESAASGQALRESLFWISTHLLIPLGGAVIGAFTAELWPRR